MNEMKLMKHYPTKFTKFLKLRKLSRDHYQLNLFHQLTSVIPKLFRKLNMSHYQLNLFHQLTSVIPKLSFNALRAAL